MSRYKVIGTFLLLVAILGVPSLAWSEDRLSVWTRGNSWEDRTLAVDVHLGVYTPQGTFGASVTKVWDQNLALSVSGGLGYLGINASLMPRIQVVEGEWALGIGVGLTVTPHPDVCAESCTPSSDFILWGNEEVYVLFQDKSSGFRFGLYLGITKPLTSHSVRIPPTSKQEDTSSIVTSFLPYAGVQAGYSF